MLRSMFKRTYTRIEAVRDTGRAEAPQGMWRKCRLCSSAVYAQDVRNNMYICPKCGGYLRVHAYRRIEILADADSFTEWNKEMEVSNPLSFPGYEEKLEAARAKTGMNEAMVTGRASILGNPCVLAVCDARFMMSSMGHNLGEKLCLAIERAIEERLPLVVYACSGGARMQEGIVSLMQMAKTSAALKRLHDAGLLYISVLTDPTTGGVTASFAMLGDIIIAEPGALIGFAGPRVISQTIGQKLPEGFQRAEFLLEHGFIDIIAERREQRELIGRLLKAHSADNKAGEADCNEADSGASDSADKEKRKTDEPAAEEKGISSSNGNKNLMSAWDRVLLSRASDRATAADYISAIFTDFTELHGDRRFADDGAIVGGIAWLEGRAVTVIAQQKGRNLKDNKKRNFGMPSPEGYRKAIRLMKQAESFKRPVICLVDTPGAFCGIEAEERGQGEAIASSLFELSGLKTPVISLVIGEGGSGGALALAVADEVWMMENAIYSILSPEGFASILYKDSKLCKEAAEDMRITSTELLRLGIIEKIIPETEPVTPENISEVSDFIKEQLKNSISRLDKYTGEELIERRYSRFRAY